MTTIKEYLPDGFIVYTTKSHKVICGAGLPNNIARYVQTHNLQPGKAWISFSDGYYEIESCEQVAMDHKKYRCSLASLLEGDEEEK